MTILTQSGDISKFVTNQCAGKRIATFFSPLVGGKKNIRETRRAYSGKETVPKSPKGLVARPEHRFY